MDELSKKKGSKIGVWGWISIVFVAFVLLMHVINGARYIIDDEYREERRAENAIKEQEEFARRAQENRLRWIANGCDTPGTCNDSGYRLDGDFSGELLIRELKNKKN